MLENLLIKETFNEFNLYHEKINKNLNLNLDCNLDLNFNYDLESLNRKVIHEIITKKQNTCLIENINNENYNIYDNEIKYKIFQDISLITKNNNNLELVLNIPSKNNILSINKIKFSDKLNKYIKDIYLKINNNKINKDVILGIVNNNKSLKIIENIYNNNIINYSTNTNIDLYIVLDKNALNYIINKNIFINYSYIIYKNKLKFS